jgi:hypothetical protein
VENKADKFEVQTMNTGGDAEVSGKVHKLTADFNEMERKSVDIERTLQRLVKD